MKHENQSLHKHEHDSPAPERSSEQIESDIRRTRGRMDATLDELGNRLSARYFINSLLDWWEAPKSGTRGNAAAMAAYHGVARQVKAHPMPSLLIGAGIAWLIRDAASKDEDEFAIEDDVEIYRTPAGSRGVASRSSDDLYANEDEFGFGAVDEPVGDQHGAGGSLSDKLGAAGEAAKQALTGATRKIKRKLGKSKGRLAESGRETAGELSQRGHDLYERGRSMGHKVGEQLEHGYEAGTARLERAVQDYPLAVGLGFAALGVLAGVLIPSSRREDEWLGEKSDQLADATREKGSELLERGKAVAHRVGDAVKEEAREQGLSAGDVGQAISGLTEKAAHLAARAKQEVSQAAKDEGLTPSQLESEAQAQMTPENRAPEQRGW